MKKILQVVIIGFLLMMNIHITPTQSASVNVEVKTWKELKAALEQSQDSNIHVSEGVIIYHEYDATTQLMDDYQIEVKGNKHLKIDGSVTFKNSVDSNTGLICLWNEDANLTLSGSGRIQYALNHYTSGTSIYLEESTLFHLGGGHLTIEDDINVIVSAATVEVSHVFIQTIVGGYKGSVHINGGNLYSNTIVNQGLDIYINGGIIDTASQFKDTSIIQEKGSLTISSGSFFGGISGNATLANGSYWVNEYGILSQEIPQNKAGVVWQKEVTLEPENPEKVIDLGDIQYGTNMHFEWDRSTLPVVPYQWGISVFDKMILVNEDTDEIVWQKENQYAYDPKGLVPGNYILKIQYGLESNNAITYIEEYRYYFSVVYGSVGELACFVECVPNAILPNVTSDIKEFDITTTWYDDDGQVLSSGTKLIEGQDYLCKIEIEANEEGYHLKDDAIVTVNGKGAIKKSQNTYEVLLTCSQLQRYLDIYDLQKPVPGMKGDVNIENDSAHYSNVTVKWYKVDEENDDVILMDADEVFEKNSKYQVEIIATLQDGYLPAIKSPSINREDVDDIFLEKIAGGPSIVTLLKNYDTSYCIDELYVNDLQYPLPSQKQDVDVTTLNHYEAKLVEWYHENGSTFSLHTGNFDANHKRYQTLIELEADENYYFAQDEQGRIIVDAYVNGKEIEFSYANDRIQDDGTCTNIVIAKTFEKASEQNCVFINGIALYDGMYLNDSNELCNSPTTKEYAHYQDGILTLNDYNCVSENQYPVIASYHDLEIKTEGISQLYGEGDGIYATANLVLGGSGQLMIVSNGYGILSFGNVTQVDGAISISSIKNSGIRIINTADQSLTIQKGLFLVSGYDYGVEADDDLPINIQEGILLMRGEYTACYRFDLYGEGLGIQVGDAEQLQPWDYVTDLSEYTAIAIYSLSADKLILKAQASDYKTILLEWNDVGASKYDIYRKTYSSDTFQYVTSTTDCNYQATVMTGKDYQYYVVGHINGEETRSNLVKGQTQLSGTPELSLEKVGNTKFKLSWNQIDGATRYIIYRKREGGSYKKVLTLGKDDFSYTTASMAAGTYYYMLRAGRYDSVDRVMTNKSNEVSGKSVFSKPVITLTAGSKQIKVSWKAVEGIKYYQVYRATSKSGKYTKLKTTTATSYTNQSLTSGKSYYYKVRGYKEYEGEKIYSSFSEIKTTKAK